MRTHNQIDIAVLIAMYKKFKNVQLSLSAKQILLL